MNRSQDYYDELIPDVEFIPRIPQKIHQIFINTSSSNKELPIEISNNIAHIQYINSNCTYKLWENEDIKIFILDNYGSKIWEYYLKINNIYAAAKADFFRYILLYKIGGVYLDLKSSTSTPIEKNINPTDTLILSHWDNEQGRQHENWGHYKFKLLPKGEFQQWHIIASPGHPFIREVIIQTLKNIDNYNPYKVGVGGTGTILTTGPIMYSKVMFRMIQKSDNYRIVDAAEDLGLIYSIYESQYDWAYHRSTLQSNYTTQIEPIVISNKKRTWFYNFYFSQIYKRIDNYSKKKDIILREAKKHPSIFSYIFHTAKSKIFR